MRISVMAILCMVSFVAANPEGSSGFDFLRIEPDARSIAMGDAVSSLADDAFAAWWNPARLSQVEKLSFGYSHIVWLAGLDCDYITAAWNTGPEGVGALGLFFETLYSAEKIEALDLNGDPMNLDISMNYSILGLTWSQGPWYIRGRDNNARVYAGATVKAIIERLYTKTLAVPSFDIGLTTESLLLDNINFALVLRNIGPPIDDRDNAGTFDQPLTIRAGASWNIFLSVRDSKEWILTPAMDFSTGIDSGLSVNNGLEFAFHDLPTRIRLSLRAGLIWLENTDTSHGFRAGCGFELKGAAVDYALTPFTISGPVHRLTFRLAM
jgi:hypothetical protein